MFAAQLLTAVGAGHRRSRNGRSRRPQRRSGVDACARTIKPRGRCSRSQRACGRLGQRLQTASCCAGCGVSGRTDRSACRFGWPSSVECLRRADFDPGCDLARRRERSVAQAGARRSPSRSLSEAAELDLEESGPGHGAVSGADRSLINAPAVRKARLAGCDDRRLGLKAARQETGLASTPWTRATEAMPDTRRRRSDPSRRAAEQGLEDVNARPRRRDRSTAVARSTRGLRSLGR